MRKLKLRPVPRYLTILDMKTRLSRTLRSTARLSLPLTFAIVALLASHSAIAGNTWDGGGGNSFWNTGANWNPDGIPSTGSTGTALTFSGNVQNITTNNLGTVDPLFSGINFGNTGIGGSSNAFTLAGNRITLGGNIVTSANAAGASATITDTISLDMILDANRSITAGQQSASVQHNLTISGIISETGGARNLTKGGNGVLTLSGTNTYTGTTAVSGGTLAYGVNDALFTGGVTVSGGTLALSTYNDSVGTVTLTGGNITGTTGVLTSTGNFNMQSGSVSAILGGAGALNKTTTGTVTLSGQNTYTGLTTVSDGTLAYGVNNALSTGGVTVSGTGTLDLSTFSDTVGTVTLTSGNITGTTGVLTSTGTFEMRSGSVSAILGGTSALSKTTTGTVTLSGENTYTGLTTVSEGTLTLSGNRTVNTTSGYTVSGGGTQTLNIQAGNYGIGGTFNVGSGGGTATVNHSAGIISSVGGSGLAMGNGSVAGTSATYNLSGGSLTTANIYMGVASGSDAANPNASTINVSGTGVLTAGTLRIGRYDAPTNNVAYNTTSTFNQTAGTTTVNNLGLGGSTNNASNSTGAILANLNLTGGTFTATNIASLSAGGAANASEANKSFINIGGTAQVTLGTFGSVVKGQNSTATITFDSGSTGFLAPVAASTNYMKAGTFTSAFLTANGANFNVGSGKDITIGQVLENASGAAGTLTKSGAGVLTLSGANTYTGLTTVSDGTLKLGSSTALGNTAGATAVGSGGLLDLNGQTGVAEALNYTGTGGLLNSAAGAATVSGTVGIGSGMTVNTTGDITLSGQLTGGTSQNLTKSGAGTLKFTAANSTFAGTNTVSAGTLLVDTGASVASSKSVVNSGLLNVNGTAGSVTVNSGGSLGGSGTVGAVTLTSGSFLKPGNSPGLLTASATSSWAAGSYYDWEIDSNASSALEGANWDLFSVTGNLDMSALSSAATMNLVLNSLSGFDLASSTNREWVIAQATGSLLGTSGTVLGAGANVSDYFNINATAFNAGTPSLVTEWRIEVGETGKTLNLMAIPEPSTGSLLGFGLAGLVVTRLLRRRRA